MPSQEDKAKTRYIITKKIIEDNGEIESKKLFALMLSQYGVRERTVAIYLNAMEVLGEISINGQIIKWCKN